MCVKTTARFCERRTASFETSSRATSVISRAMKASENAEDGVRHDIESNVVQGGTKLNLEKSCEARYGDERMSSSHLNLERRNCWSVKRSQSVKSESDGPFECRCVKDQSVMIILVTRACWELESRSAVLYTHVIYRLHSVSQSLQFVAVCCRRQWQ